MLPIISDTTARNLVEEIFATDMPSWRKKMIHHIKDENPELNSAIIEAANLSGLDPKAIALGAYLTYLLLEVTEKETDEMLSYNE